MTPSTPRKHKIVVDIYSENISVRETSELKRTVAHTISGSSVRSHSYHVARKASGVTPLEIVHEIIVIISTHKELWLAAGGYAGKKLLDIMTEIIKRWARSRPKKQNVAVYLFDADGKPLKRIEVKDGKERKARTPWKERARTIAEWARYE